MQMTPERALAIRVDRVLKKKVTSPKASERLLPLPEMMKQILVFKQSEYHHLIRDFVLFRMPNNELGVSSRKMVYPVRHSGEYLFIDISAGRTPKTNCSVVNSAALASERLRISSSPSLQALADGLSDHADGPKLRKIASEIRGHPVVNRGGKARIMNPGMKLAERWLRQLKLAENQTASEEVRKMALVQLAKIEQEMASLDIDHFKWPSTEALTGSGALNSFDAPSDGVLSFFGYEVGQSSRLNSSTRYAVLHRVFRIMLPQMLPTTHMALWGPANSGWRLKKIAETIAAFVRNAKRRRNPSYSQAIDDWEYDLQRLHDALYVGRFDFVWPQTR
ncbi:hypothetical protein QWJ46_17730 [Rhizobium sp. CBN3]|uniref:hypothetical protein n=1 Tax=Rhizobium sp. CBN3 TaxID=3058045 RepID=UPI0026739FEF|nr:hypothetical protein [Rhizobium sp. CBN3]MDO3434520.1 hypothetical protein [Rhizobium sp. CBN3]